MASIFFLRNCQNDVEVNVPDRLRPSHRGEPPPGVESTLPYAVSTGLLYFGTYGPPRGPAAVAVELDESKGGTKASSPWPLIGHNRSASTNQHAWALLGTVASHLVGRCIAGQPVRNGPKCWQNSGKFARLTRGALDPLRAPVGYHGGGRCSCSRRTARPGSWRWHRPGAVSRRMDHVGHWTHVGCTMPFHRVELPRGSGVVGSSQCASLGARASGELHDSSGVSRAPSPCRSGGRVGRHVQVAAYSHHIALRWTGSPAFRLTRSAASTG